MDCKDIGGFCNFTDFQTWYCEWKEMDLFEELCPLPSICCVPKASKWKYFLSFIPSIKIIAYFSISFFILLSTGILITKLAKRFVAKQTRKTSFATTSAEDHNKFATTLAIETWAVKTLIKLLPTVSKKELKIGQKISSGKFLVLHKSKLHDSSVCLKSMKCQNDHFDIFLNEAAILWHIRLSAHLFKTMPLHICNFNGICQLRPDQFGIVFEWMNLGSVWAFLSEQKTNSTNVGKQLDSKDLLRIAIQICAGVYQLHTLLIIHGNVSARNCLLAGDPFKPEKLIAKLADFGNSQIIPTKNAFYECWASERSVWPYKWMAPECFVTGENEKHQFSLHSDIWSFGAFLLELFSFGDEPYPNLSSADAKTLLLMDPKMNNALNFTETFIPNDVKRIIRKCFALAPKDRPKAENLIKLLQQC
ncbi:hypothetical protein niasHS_017329 [Heterodera schachtii]|uniref:Protein kinase domain-containing protein n=1 Tax=Heterodera schachtii TaxID=97005 RepID=A0ABD2I6J9_HETSC